MAGRPRKPDEEHILKGTFRKDRHGDPSASIVADGEPIRPASVKGAAIRVWNEIIPQLIGLGIAKQIDSDAIAMYCRLVAQRDKLLAAVERMPAIDKRRGKLSREAMVYEGVIHKLRQAFGLDCLARTKLRQPVKQTNLGVRTRKRG